MMWLKTSNKLEMILFSILIICIVYFENVQGGAVLSSKEDFDIKKPFVFNANDFKLSSNQDDSLQRHRRDVKDDKLVPNITSVSIHRIIL